MIKLGIALATAAAAFAVATPAMAQTTLPYQATYVEPVGGPNGSPFSCAPATSCGSASISGIGHSDNQVVQFNACGFGCHVRTVIFADGATLVIRTEDRRAASPSPRRATRAAMATSDSRQETATRSSLTSRKPSPVARDDSQVQAEKEPAPSSFTAGWLSATRRGPSLP